MNDGKKLCIYFFYEPSGIVDEYVIDCLREMALNVSDILFVSNSKLQTESRRRLAQLPQVRVTQRSNEGFDVWAYKHGIDLLGWKKISAYDEVIFMNFTIVGPLYPFKDMFDEMSRRDVDFWGINVHSGESFDPWGTMPEGVIPKHLQSHFIAVRSKMLNSKEFRHYWDTMRPILSYQEAVGYHEAVFTQIFERLGYKWDSYINTEDLEDLTSYPLMFMPKEVIKNRRSPIFKRKSLILSMDDYAANGTGTAVVETLDCLKDIGYDLSKIMPNIMRTGNQYDIRMAMNATYIIPDTTQVGERKSVGIIIYVDSDRKLQLVKSYLDDMVLSASVHLVVGARVKDISFVKGMTFEHGGYIDFIHAIEKASMSYAVIGTLGLSTDAKKSGLNEFEFYKYGLEALFANTKVINNTVAQLLANDFYGAFAAPSAVQAHDDDDNWRRRFKKTQRFLLSIGNTVNVRADKLPLSSRSDIFWIKSASLRQVDWPKVYEELHALTAIDRQRVFNYSLPFIMQQNGFLTGYAMTSRTAENLVTMLMYKKDIHAAEEIAKPALNVRYDQPSNLYLMRNGKFSEKNKLVRVVNKQDDGTFQVEFVISRDSDQTRFDPVVQMIGVVAKNAKATLNGSPVKITAANALSYAETDLFLTSDPQYVIEGAVNKGDHLVITFDDLKYYSEHDFTPSHEKIGYGGELSNAIRHMHNYYQKYLHKQRKHRIWQKRSS